MDGRRKKGLSTLDEKNCMSHAWMHCIQPSNRIRIMGFGQSALQEILIAHSSSFHFYVQRKDLDYIVDSFPNFKLLARLGC